MKTDADKSPTSNNQNAADRPSQSEGISATPPSYGIGAVDRMARNENRTGLPDNLKSGIEQLSGLSMDDVRVHYNSPKPAELGALAYTQGTEIHVGPGEEKHLPHEAWHVVQQKQGLVHPLKPLTQRLWSNEQPDLERNADLMSLRAEEYTKSKIQPNNATDPYLSYAPRDAHNADITSMPSLRSLPTLPSTPTIQMRKIKTRTGKTIYTENYDRDILDRVRIIFLLSGDSQTANEILAAIEAGEYQKPFPDNLLQWLNNDSTSLINNSRLEPLGESKAINSATEENKLINPENPLMDVPFNKTLDQAMNDTSPTPMEVPDNPLSSTNNPKPVKPESHPIGEAKGGFLDRLKAQILVSMITAYQAAWLHGAYRDLANSGNTSAPPSLMKYRTVPNLTPNPLFTGFQSSLLGVAMNPKTVLKANRPLIFATLAASGAMLGIGASLGIVKDSINFVRDKLKRQNNQGQ